MKAPPWIQNSTGSLLSAVAWAGVQMLRVRQSSLSGGTMAS